MLDREVDDGAANLHGLVEAWQERSPLLDEDQGSELALVVFEQELASFKLDFGVAPGYRDVVDAQVTLVPSSQLEDSLARAGTDYVNDSRVVLLLRQTFEHHEVALRLFVLNQIVGADAAVLGLGLQLQRVRSFTNLALKRLPEESLEVARHFGLLAGFEPSGEAGEVDLAHGSRAFARSEQRVVFAGF